MKISNDKLFTPIYVKTRDNQKLPKEKAYFLLTQSGLFICREDELFSSCVPARNAPQELSKQVPFLKVNCPKIPQRLMEKSVGFLSDIAEKYNAESAILLFYNDSESKMKIVIPEQKCRVYRDPQGGLFPLNINYKIHDVLKEEGLDHSWRLIGDIHSHVDGNAFASDTDIEDENYRPGIHIVVGKIHNEPPDFHVEMTIDGFRFILEQDEIIEGYLKRIKWKSEKIAQRVTIEYMYSMQHYQSSVTIPVQYVGPVKVQ